MDNLENLAPPDQKEIHKSSSFSSSTTLNPMESRRILWKIDLVLVPMMGISNFLMFLDKTTLSYANLMGIKADNHLTGQQLSWLGSLFYLGYLAWQIPAGYLLQRLPIRWHLSGMIIAWGTVLCAHAACTNFAGLATCRFLLGVTESVMIPAFTTLTGMFYKAEEQYARVSLWFGTIGIAQIVGGAMSYGIARMDASQHVLNQWQTLFLITGVITVVFGLICLFIVPSTPSDAWFLTHQERISAIERLSSDKRGTVSYDFEFYQVREALFDPRLYLVGLSVFALAIPNGGVTSFGAVIIQGFGYSTLQTLLLGMSTGASEIAAVAVGYVIARYTNTRVAPATTMHCMAIVGASLMIGSGVSRNVQFAGYCLTAWSPVSIVYLLSWMSSMISGQTKRIVYYVFYQLCYAAGNVIGSNIFRESDAPAYVAAKTGVLAGYVVDVVAFAAIAFLHFKWNRSKDATALEKKNLEEEENDLQFLNKTDFEVSSFRWPY
uniref:Major facilitator superfamily (MFS) profile domain-containing protein n=1 Tax=Moniliophthora roreri TaxID=221103 RepID=A0A0W0FSC0_MONRR